jgi:hypothetical protein
LDINDRTMMRERGREQIARREDVMNTKIKRTLIGALAATVAVTSFSIEPVRAAPANKAPAAAQAPADMPTDVSTQSRRRHYRGGTNPAQALAMFGMIAGTIAAVSASRRHHRRYYGGQPFGHYGPYYGGGYGSPYGYGPPPGYYGGGYYRY